VIQTIERHGSFPFVAQMGRLDLRLHPAIWRGFLLAIHPMPAPS
jgi:hypothetical protein